MARVALVTGGTRGIGAAISKAFSHDGYEVAANYRGNEDAARAFHEATAVKVYRWDVADFDACAQGVARVTQDLGAIDVLVNNAGITRDRVLHKMAPEDWEAVVQTNLTSCFNMTRAVIESMRARGFGRIVNISSINGQAGQFGQTNYAAAKAGLLGFTKALALESATKGITVNAVAPGYIETDMVRAVAPEMREKIIARIPAGRLGEAEEVARAVLFLASDEAGFVNGSTLTMNGAQYMI